VPADALRCADCEHNQLVEDWTAPLTPAKQGRCINCGGRYKIDRCIHCGLTAQENVQVHEELRAMVTKDPGLFAGARAASRMGRNVLALKLATAAASEPGSRSAPVARAFRVWLLAQVGHQDAALDDARAWVDDHPDPPAMAWAAFGQQLQQAKQPGAAASAYGKALDIDPRQHPIRARRAVLLFELHREGQAMDEAGKVFEARADDNSVQAALTVTEQLCDLLATRYRDDEIQHTLTRAGAYVSRSAKLLGYRALLAAKGGDTAGAKRALKKARRLNPDLEIYEEIKRILKPASARASWWKW